MNFMLVRILLFPLLIVSVFSCVPIANDIKSDSSLDLSSNGAIAVRITSSGIPYLHGLGFFYAPVGTNNEVGIDAYNTNSPGYWNDYYEDVDKGRLAIIELAPGEYEFQRWVANAGGFGGVRSINPQKPISIKFSVEKGKLFYLGNIHLLSNNVGKASVDGAISYHRVIVRDKSESDLTEIKTRLAKNTNTPVIVRLAESSQ